MNIQKILPLPADLKYHTEICNLPGLEGIPIPIMDAMIITESSPYIWYMDERTGLYYRIDEEGKKTKPQKDIYNPDIFLRLLTIICKGLYEVWRRIFVNKSH